MISLGAGVMSTGGAIAMLGWRNSHLQTFLASLDGSDITSDTTANDNQIVIPCCPADRRSANCARGGRGSCLALPQRWIVLRLTCIRGVATL